MSSSARKYYWTRNYCFEMLLWKHPHAMVKTKTRITTISHFLHKRKQNPALTKSLLTLKILISTNNFDILCELNGKILSKCGLLDRPEAPFTFYGIFVQHDYYYYCPRSSSFTGNFFLMTIIVVISAYCNLAKYLTLFTHWQSIQTLKDKVMFEALHGVDSRK